MNLSDIPAWVQALAVVIPAAVGVVAWFVRTQDRQAATEARVANLEKGMDRVAELKTDMALLNQKIDMKFEYLGEQIRQAQEKP